MNNNAKRLTRVSAESICDIISIAIDDPSTKKEITKGGGSAGGPLTRALNIRQIENVRISTDAFKILRKNNINIINYFLLSRDGKNSQFQKKYGKIMSSNKKTVEGCHADGCFIRVDHNIPNKAMIDIIYNLVKQYKEQNKDREYIVKKIIAVLNKQSLDFITVEENKKIDDAGFQASGSKEERDALCSPKIPLKDIWLTPQHIIDQFFKTSKLDKNLCFDPCASDGRWLGEKGISSDILPIESNVIEQDFLKIKKMPDGIKYIVGNIPFFLTKEFVEKSFDLTGEAFFLVNGDTIMKYYNGHIKKIWIINGIEGNQKDYRSKCEFDTIILKKSALWCCIVHLTKEEQKKFIIEKNISNQEKRDGYHIALGKNTYIKSSVLVEKNERIIRLETKGTIKYN